MVTIIKRVVSRYLAAGFSFQPDEVERVVVDAHRLLDEVSHLIEDFAQDEDFAEHLLAISKKNDNEALKAVDRKKFSDFSSKFWQSRNWFHDLAQKVPYLVLEVIKIDGSSPKLEKIHDFYKKPFRWAPKMDPYKEVSEKYLATLKVLQDQLKLLQEAVGRIGTKGLEPTRIGKFELFGGNSPKAIEVLKKATKDLTSIGLGSYCTGKVTLVDTSKLHGGSAAFYVKNTDEIYLSPEVSGNQDVRALCHEIAHRIHTQLHLRNKSQRLYEAIKEKGSWVTSYAKTNPEENFCEMISFAAIKELDAEESRDLLKATLPSLRI